MALYEVTIDPVDDEPFIFYAGHLEPGEIGSIVVAVDKRMDGEPAGWSLHIRKLTGENDARIHP